MTALFITPEKRAEIDAAVREARAHVISWDQLRGLAIDDSAMATGTMALSDRKPGTKRPDSIGVTFEGGVTAAISFEEQPAGILRHASFATGKSGKNHLPHPVLIGTLCELFGFREFPPRVGRMWIEEYKPDQWAVNVIEMEQEREVAGHA